MPTRVDARVAQVLGGLAVLAGVSHLAQAPQAAIVPLSPLAAPPQPASWEPSDPARYRGGPGHRGGSPFRGPVSPTVRYAFATGGPVRGRVLVDPGGQVVFASFDGGLYFLDAAGGLRARRELGAPSHGGPVRTREGIVVGTDAGVLFQFSDAGEPRARLALGAAIDAPVSEGPDGTLWVTAGARVVGVSGDLARRVRVLPAKGRVVVAPAVDAAGGVYLAGQDHHVRAFGAGGAPRFAVDLGRDLEAPPLLAGDLLLVAGDGGLLVGLARADGALRFRVELDGHVRAPMALHGDALWLQTFGPRPGLVALSLADGNVLGGHRFALLDSDAQGSRSGPLVDESGAVFVGGPDDAIYGFDPRGQLRFRVATAGDVHGAPNLGPDGTLYIGCDDGRLYALSD